jgi:hypothetical protein
VIDDGSEDVIAEKPVKGTHVVRLIIVGAASFAAGLMQVCEMTLILLSTRTPITNIAEDIQN